MFVVTGLSFPWQTYVCLYVSINFLVRLMFAYMCLSTFLLDLCLLLCVYQLSCQTYVCLYVSINFLGRLLFASMRLSTFLVDLCLPLCVYQLSCQTLCLPICVYQLTWQIYVCLHVSINFLRRLMFSFMCLSTFLVDVGLCLTPCVYQLSCFLVFLLDLCLPSCVYQLFVQPYVCLHVSIDNPCINFPHRLVCVCQLSCQTYVCLHVSINFLDRISLPSCVYQLFDRLIFAFMCLSTFLTDLCLL